MDLLTQRSQHSIQERNEFEAYDKIHGLRAKFVEALKAKFPDYGLTYSIGGQISFDVVSLTFFYSISQCLGC